MASNDPSDTGGLFVGRRPGTRPVRFPNVPGDVAARRRNADKLLSASLLVLETLVCLTVWGPQPALALWFGSRLQYWTGSVSVGILGAFVLMLITLFGTLMIARRIDYAWKLVRRAAGYRQERGALERIFVISLIIGGAIFFFWFLILNGPGSSVFSPQAN
jgi:hypothetical protein